MKYIYIVFFLLLSPCADAQLKPNFDAREYLELLRISRQQFDTIIKGDHTPKPNLYHMIYRSPVGPLQNRWDLWVDAKKTAVISIRGTTRSNISWLENFYAAMVPANGQLHIDDSTNFDYHLATDPRAAVHIGWLLGMAYISKTVVQQINLLYQSQGIKNFIIMGHSQGGTIAFLLRSYIADLQSKKLIPADITFKTYSSAPPKPGNTYYVYDYDYLTRGGWGLAVINTADWVPETPFSIQTFDDFNSPNPFENADKEINKQSFFVGLYLKHVFNRLKKPSKKAQKNNEKYLGHMVYKFIKKQLPQFKEPVYAPTNTYTSCGTPIILLTDDDYKQKFIPKKGNIFTHHMFWPYYYLTEKQYTHQ